MPEAEYHAQKEYDLYEEDDEYKFIREHKLRTHPVIIQKMADAGIQMPIAPDDDIEQADMNLSDQHERAIIKRDKAVLTKLNNKDAQPKEDGFYLYFAAAMVERVQQNIVLQTNTQLDKIYIVRDLQHIMLNQELGDLRYADPEELIDELQRKIMGDTSRGYCFDLTEQEKAATLNIINELTGAEFDLADFLEKQSESRDSIDRLGSELKHISHQKYVAMQAIDSVIGAGYEVHDDWDSFVSRSLKFRYLGHYSAITAAYGGWRNMPQGEQMTQEQINEHTLAFIGISVLNILKSKAQRMGVPEDVIKQYFDTICSD